MNPIPHITKEQAVAIDSLDPNYWYEVVNERIDKANAEQEQPLITAKEARKLGVGKAEWKSGGYADWQICGEDFQYFSIGVQYRAIKQEPVEQRCKYCDDTGSVHGIDGEFKTACTSCYANKVEPICQVLNDDTGELKTMTREAAKKLQAKLGNTAEWSVPVHVTWHGKSDLTFELAGIYKLKANLVKLDGKLMTREVAIAKCKAVEDKQDVWYKSNQTNRFEKRERVHFDLHNATGKPEYQLRAKPLKQVSWASVPVGVITNRGELRNVYQPVFGNNGLQATIELRDTNSVRTAEFYCKDLVLAPASEQPWVNWRGGDCPVPEGCMFEATFRSSRQYESSDIEDPYSNNSWKHADQPHDIIEYRVTGLAEGYELK